MGCICDGIKLKCSATVGPIEENKQSPPTLTQEEIAAVRNNWHCLNMYLSNVGLNTFICLFESKPELQELFKNFRGKGLRELRLTGLLRKHSLRVMATLDKHVIHLDDPSFIVPALHELGMQHAKSEVPMEYLEFVLPHFLNAIKPYIEEYWCNAMEEAWTKVIDKNKMRKYCNGLTPVTLIINSVPFLRTQCKMVTERTSLFESKPELQELFKNFRGKGLRELRLTGLLRKHSLRVMATLDKHVIHLDDPTFIVPALHELGMQHAKSDVPMEYLEFVLPHFLNAIKPYIEDYWCNAIEEAWIKVFNLMLYHIREGMFQYNGK